MNYFEDCCCRACCFERRERRAIERRLLMAGDALFAFGGLAFFTVALGVIAYLCGAR